MIASGSKTGGKGAAGPTFKNPQLVTPLADGILVGGLSIAVIVVVLLVGLVMPTAYDSFSTLDPSGSVTAEGDAPSMSGMMRLDHLALIIILQTMINGPHFMGSYWMLYTTRGQLKRYPWSTIYMPILLVGMALLSVVLVVVFPPLIERGLGEVSPEVGLAGMTFVGLAAVQVLSYPFHDPVLTDRAFITSPRVMVRAFVLAGLLSGGFILLFSSVGLYARLRAFRHGLGGGAGVVRPAPAAGFQRHHADQRRIDPGFHLCQHGETHRARLVQPHR